MSRRTLINRRIAREAGYEWQMLRTANDGRQWAHVVYISPYDIKAGPRCIAAMLRRGRREIQRAVEEANKKGNENA